MLTQAEDRTGASRAIFQQHRLSSIWICGSESLRNAEASERLCEAMMCRKVE